MNHFSAFTPPGPLEAAAKYLTDRIPRYTSYPTAPHFTPSVTDADYGAWLSALPGDASLSLYLHVPFCRTLCWYCGCNTTVTRHRAPVEDYMRLLLREVAQVADRAGGRRVAHIHWGGGTPTVAGPAAFGAAMALLRERFDVAADAEIAVEIDPRQLDAGMAAALARSGVNRASLGVQTFDPVVQKAVARVQPLDVTQACAAHLRGAGIGALNVDLLYGLPHQTVASCEESVRDALTLAPARFSVFGYAHVPTMKRHQAVIAADTLPGAAERVAQEQAIGDALARAGYVRIGLDHYARADDPLALAQQGGGRSDRLRRNFQGYTDDPAEALIGFGASAIGQLPQGYVQNAPHLRDWSERIEAGRFATVRGRALSADDRLRADIIERLMCDLWADVPGTLARHGFPADALDAEIAALAALESDGLVSNDEGVLTVPEPMRALVRRVACVFDAYLNPAAARHAVAV
ncbi:MAG: oxygen-independent coproporphyrinogen III oxidase [Proteobacteria bacterium]|nr:oxygen-independent coproporphyrinogen III oxidase [Pseudomonadota bacterium]